MIPEGERESSGFSREAVPERFLERASLPPPLARRELGKRERLPDAMVASPVLSSGK